jgi:hypothetical protein
VSVTDLSHVAAIQARLAEIDEDLAARQPVLERAATAWFKAKRNREEQRARAFMTADGTVAERNAHADIVTSLVGVNEEAEWEALKAVVRVLETRASIGSPNGRMEPLRALARTKRVVSVCDNGVVVDIRGSITIRAVAALTASLTAPAPVL